MRDRLIELIKQGDKTFADKYTGKVMSHIDEIYDFTADYLLANGVIVPPCQVGDKIYGLFECNRLDGKTRVVKYIVDELLFSTKRGVRPWVICCYGGRRFDNFDFGKTVFLTREEAEQALKGGEQG